jgi:signal transduction histidine kinase
MYFSAALIFVVIVLSTISLYQSYKKFERERDLLLYQDARKVQMFFDERVMYIEHILQFIGTKIYRDPNQTLESIAGVIKHHRKNFNDDAFSWNLFTLISPDFKIVAESLHGVRKDPISIDVERRKWLKEAQKNFWKIKFSKPDIALISGDYILPSGISIPNKDKTQPAWYLAAGISIEKLTTRLLRVIDESSSFIVMDEERNVITSSEPQIFSMKDKLPAWLDNYSSAPDVQRMYKTLAIDKFDYHYSIHSEKYPFVIFIGQDRKTYRTLLIDEFIPRVIIYLSAGVIFSFVILFLGYQVIRPILLFGKSAEAISKGNPVSIPKYPQKELRILGTQLEKLDVINRDLRNKQFQLAKINNELQNANAFIKSNMSFLSHELANPISTILGFAQLLKQNFVNHRYEEAKEVVEIIEKAAVHQNKQLNFFLRLFQFQEAPVKKMIKKTLDIKQVIEWNVSMIRHHAKEKNIAIEMNIEPHLKMMGDEIMIGQLIQNLAANAAKYNKPNGKIIINAYSRYAKQVVIDFIDTGIGIAQKDISKIFRKFTRLSSKEQKMTIGYGIGLAYAKRCALLHGGRIRVKSKLGVGSIFSVILPKD